MSLKKLYIELTNKCNLNCSICYRKSWKDKLCDMDRGLFNKIYEETRDIKNLKSIVLGGIGEPTVSPLIYEAIRVFKNYDLTITTNGTLMDDGLIKLIVKHVNNIIVSIDGLQDNLEKIRGIDLNTVIDNIGRIVAEKERAKKKAPILNIQFVASEDNIDDIFQLIDLGETMKVDGIIISNLLPQTGDYKDKILYKRYENNSLKNLLQRLNSYALSKGMRTVLASYELKTERRCNFIDDDTTYVTSSGDIVPCYRLAHTYKEYVFGREKLVKKYIFGNLKSKSLMDIWNDETYMKFRSVVYNNLYPSCIDCDLAEGCDMVNDTEMDCYGNSPSCGDCLWARKFIICP